MDTPAKYFIDYELPHREEFYRFYLKLKIKYEADPSKREYYNNNYRRSEQGYNFCDFYHWCWFTSNTFIYDFHHGDETAAIYHPKKCFEKWAPEIPQFLINTYFPFLSLKVPDKKITDLHDFFVYLIKSEMT